MSLKRKPDWQARLISYIGAQAGRPYAEGDWDCALFAAGAVRAMTGRDLARGWRGYRSIAEGLAALRAAGLRDHVALAAKHLPEIRTTEGAPWPAGACPGDLAVVPVPEGEALGIVQGPKIYLLSAAGLVTVPLTSATRAFRI